jgi:hypothetical protein
MRAPSLMSGQKEYFYAHRQEIDTIYNKKNNYLQNTESNPFFDIFSLEKKKKKKKKKKRKKERNSQPSPTPNVATAPRREIFRFR